VLAKHKVAGSTPVTRSTVSPLATGPRRSDHDDQMTSGGDTLDEPRSAPVTVAATLERALARLAGGNGEAPRPSRGPDAPLGDPIFAARTWLGRAEIFLAWVAKHPSFAEIRDEAARLLIQLRGTAEVAAAETPPAEPLKDAGSRPAR
jgi:hypothetical protein